jgi:hypothetical protein
VVTKTSSRSEEEVEGLTDEWRLAYVARLLRSMALLYGMASEFRRDPLAEEDAWSVGRIVRGLNDISWIR